MRRSRSWGFKTGSTSLRISTRATRSSQVRPSAMVNTTGSRMARRTVSRTSRKRSSRSSTSFDAGMLRRAQPRSRGHRRSAAGVSDGRHCRGLAGSIGINYAYHDVEVTLGPTAVLTSLLINDANVSSSIIENAQTQASAAASEPEEDDGSTKSTASVSVALGLGIFTNIDKTTVEGSSAGAASIDANGTVTVGARNLSYPFLIDNPVSRLRSARVHQDQRTPTGTPSYAGRHPRNRLEPLQYDGVDHRRPGQGRCRRFVRAQLL